MKELYYLGSFAEGKTLTADKYTRLGELFAAGTHRGVTYTKEDIKQLVSEFKTEEEIPVQLDHSESAKDTVGFVRKVYQEDGRLMGELEILDEEVQKRIDKGLMKKLSIGFYIRETDDGFKPYKLREVSLVAFPQIKTARLFSEGNYMSNFEEVKQLDGKEKQKAQEVKLTEQEVKEFMTKYSALESLVKTLTTETIGTKIAKFAQEGKIVPAQGEALNKLLLSFDEKQMKLFDEFMANSKVLSMQEVGQFEQHSADEEPKSKMSKEQEEFEKFYEEHVKVYGSTL